MNLMIKYEIPSVEVLKQNTEQGNHKFSVVSTFAGGGGSSTGYRMAGGKVLLVNEFVEEALNTYRANWPTTKTLGADVRQITGEQILSETGFKPLELDIFDGSPPCSAFSIMGAKEKGWGDNNKSYSDTSQSNIEDLFFEYIRLVEGVKPKVFVAENVAGLTVGKSKGYLNQILRKMRSIGYHVEARILDARWLGVPQSRMRLIFVGVHESIMQDKFKGRLHPKPFNYFIPLTTAFEGLTFSEEDRVNTSMEHGKTYGLLQKLEIGQSYKNTYFNLVKASPDAPSPCISATAAAPTAASAKHWDNRGFSIPEVKRIMSIPDDYILTGSYQKRMERLGRMVPPLMMKAVAENIYRVVLCAE